MITQPKSAQTQPSQTPPIPAELIEAFREKPARVVMLAGAGLSSRVQREDGRPFPSWVELLRELYHWAESQGFIFTPEQERSFEALISRGDSRGLIHAAGWLKGEIQEPFFNEFMAARFQWLPKVAHATHRLLSQLPFRGTITFNYDCLIESALNIPPYAVATPDDDEKLSQIQRCELSPFLLKAHGDIGRPGTLILGHKDYRNVIFAHAAYRKVLATLFEQNVILMIGYGLDDPDLEYLFDEALSTFASAPLKIFALVPKGQINAILREQWRRERKLRLIEYETRGVDHSGVDAFLRALGAEVNRPSIDTAVARIADSCSGDFSPFVKAARSRLVHLWNQASTRQADTKNAYAIARERAQLIDEVVKEVLEESMQTAAWSSARFAIIARGGYGRGHLTSNSDIDVTLLHLPSQKKKALKLFSAFLTCLQDTVSAVNLQARPIVNTLQECQNHWSTCESLTSFAFSRLVAGDLQLHGQLRLLWREHVRSAPLEPLVEDIRKKRLPREVERVQPLSLNIKYCAGGILDLMLVRFLEEALGIKEMARQESDVPAGDIDIHLNQLLRIREIAFGTSRTLVLDRRQVPPQALGAENWDLLTKCRVAIRARLESALSRLASGLNMS